MLDIRPGVILGQYEIIRYLASGGMGDVYLAKHTRLGVERAIKVVRPELARQHDFRQRFEAEARAVANLSHPNILRVVDFADTDDLAYMVMELASGGSLADWGEKPWSVENVRRALSPIASALDYAHAQRIVHRDVKPSNILRRADGAPVLTDFGLFQDLESTLTADQAARVEGAPYYMAPEQAAGLAAVPASDQYALACVAYELLTGQPPFNGSSTLAILNAHIGTLPPSPRSLNPRLSPATERALIRALAKKPSERYPTVTAFVTALQSPVMDIPRPNFVIAAALLAILLAAAILNRGVIDLALIPPVPNSTPVTTPLDLAANHLTTTPRLPGSPVDHQAASPQSIALEAVAPDRTVLSANATVAATVATPTIQPSMSPSPTATEIESIATPIPAAAPLAPRTLTSVPPPGTATSTVASTPSVTFTNTRSATPATTATATVATTYPSPVLAAASADGGSVTLTWTYAHQLASDEWFDVRIWNDSAGSANRGVANTKQARYQVGSGFVYGPGTYNWTIAVIRKLGNGSTVTLADADQTLQFTFTPSGTRCRTYPNC
jgi:serine/threonine-protein kinase